MPPLAGPVLSHFPEVSRMSRLRIGVGAGVASLAAAVVVWATASWVQSSRFRSELGRLEAAVERGRYESAGDRLRTLAAGRPGHPRLHYLLGLCERASGDVEAALAAWSKVPADAPKAAEAALHSASILIDEGRWAEAEPRLSLALALEARGPTAVEARRRLVDLLVLQGRLDEASRLLREGWDESRDRLALLRDLWMLETAAWSTEANATVLEQASRSAPEDDRVRLGLAYLAMHRGRPGEAGRHLDAILRDRPDDPAAWGHRLRLARQSGDVRSALRSLRHLSSDRFRPADLPEIEAWFASRAGDLEGERLALEVLLELDPGRLPALERLIELTLRGGDADRAAALRARKAELDEARNRYDDQLSGSREEAGAAPAEMARLAESLGMTFEARCWATLAVLDDPGDDPSRAMLDRLGRASPTPRASEEEFEALLDRVGSLSGVVPPPARPPGPSPEVITPRFVDEAGSAGLDFVHVAGRSEARHLPETMSGGVGLLDFDGDGRLDVYCVQGGPRFPPPDDVPFGDLLYRNRGDGTFEDATDASGLSGFPGGYGHGVTVGDVDDDGFPDLFVTRWRSYALYRNRGDGTFEDATDASGLGGERGWPTSAAFADLDGDGDGDLYVCHYLDFDPSAPPDCRHDGRRIYCSPRDLVPQADRVYRNDGGRFVDVSEESGIADRVGPGLGVVSADLDDDGRLDLYVANDMEANFLFRNLGGFRFEEVGEPAGVASAGDGTYEAGMGVDCADLDGDGRLDLVVGNYYGEGTTLYRNLGGGAFIDASDAAGVGPATREVLSFGLAAIDANADSRPDLAIANGHVADLRPEQPMAMPPMLLANLGGGRFADVSGRAGPPWQAPRLGRGLASGDLDNDGRVDLVLLNQDAPLTFLRNRTEGAGHWLTILLEGTASDRDAVGARVSVEAGGRRLAFVREGGGSYQSSGDPRILVGLGDLGVAEAVEVAWPSGRIDRFESLGADSAYRLVEGDPEPRPLTGFDP